MTDLPVVDVPELPRVRAKQPAQLRLQRLVMLRIIIGGIITSSYVIREARISSASLKALRSFGAPLRYLGFFMTHGRNTFESLGLTLAKAAPIFSGNKLIFNLIPPNEMKFIPSM
jgi:hypothetical protein